MDVRSSAFMTRLTAPAEGSDHCHRLPADTQSSPAREQDNGVPETATLAMQADLMSGASGSSQPIHLKEYLVGKSIAVGVVSALALAVPSASRADGPAWRMFEGLYEPANSDGMAWTCQARDLGQEGGALGVVDGELYGVENTCDLSRPRLSPDGSVTFASTCDAEGERIKEEITLAVTSDGVSVSRNGWTTEWRSCTQPDARADEISAPGHDATFSLWTSYFGMGWTEATTRDGRGSTITFACGEDREQRYDGSIRVFISGSTQASGPIRFVVDGESFDMTQLSDGSVDLNCSGCAQTFRSLWVAVAMGNSLTVSDKGRSATFSLAGSGGAMGYDVCRIGEPLQ